MIRQRITFASAISQHSSKRRVKLMHDSSQCIVGREIPMRSRSMITPIFWMTMMMRLLIRRMCQRIKISLISDTT